MPEIRKHIYKGFISYSHRADKKLAAALQSGLHSLGRPHYRSRAMWVYRDDTDMSANHALWPEIEKALVGSEYLILMACAESAASIWVRREIDCWLKLHKGSVANILIVWTGGELEWDNVGGKDFDWTKTTALPQELRWNDGEGQTFETLAGKFTEGVPRFIDFRPFINATSLSLANAEFYNEVANVSAKLRGVSKSEVIGEDAARLRRYKRTKMAAVSVLSILLVASTVLGLFAYRQMLTARAAQAEAEEARGRAEAALAREKAEREQKEAALENEKVARKGETDAKEAAQQALVQEKAAKQLAEEKRREADANAAEARRQLTHNQHLLYAADIGATMQAYETPDMARMVERLDAYAPAQESAHASGFRGFEWYYLWHLAHKETATLHGHTGPVIAVALAPGGKIVATGAENDDNILLWNLAAGTARRITIPDLGTGPPDHGYVSLTFSPDGGRLAVCGRNPVKVYDVASGKPALGPLPASEKSSRAAFSPDGKTLATNSADGTRLWDLASGTQTDFIPQADQTFVQALAFSPKGGQLATLTSEKKAQVWNLPTRGKTSPDYEFDVESSDFLIIGSAMLFSPDGEKLVVVTRDGSVQTHELKTGAATTTRLKRGADEWIVSLAVSPDGKKVATGSDESSIRLWDAETGDLLNTFKGHVARIESVSFSPDGRTLASGSSLPNKIVTNFPDAGEIKLWDVAADPETVFIPTDDVESSNATLEALAFSPDGKNVLGIGSSTPLKVWDAATGARRASLEEYDSKSLGSGLAYSPKGDTIAVARRNNVVVLDARSYRELYELNDPNGTEQDMVETLAFSRDGNWLAAGTFEAGVKVWNLRSRKLFTLKRNSDDFEENVVQAVAFLPREGMLVTGHYRGEVILWDIARRKQVRTLANHGQIVTSVAVSPDGETVASAAFDGIVKLSRIDGRSAPVDLKGHLKYVRAVAFSPDGKTVASGGDDGTVRLWDTFTHQQLIKLKAAEPRGEGWIFSLAFSSDGRTLAAGNNAGSLYLWHAAPGDEYAARPATRAWPRRHARGD